MDQLIINDEFRLSQQVLDLKEKDNYQNYIKEKDNYQNYIIDKKLKGKDEQIKILTSKVDEYVEVQKE